MKVDKLSGIPFDLITDSNVQSLYVKKFQWFLVDWHNQVTAIGGYSAGTRHARCRMENVISLFIRVP